MGAYPFTPVFTDARTLDGSELELNVGKVTLLPSVSAFVGGDITAGMYVLKLGKSNVPTLLLDIGTNGEMVLDTEKRGETALSRPPPRQDRHLKAQIFHAEWAELRALSLRLSVVHRES